MAFTKEHSATSFLRLHRKQVSATHDEAARDGVTVPKSLAEYCAMSSRPLTRQQSSYDDPDFNFDEDDQDDDDDDDDEDDEDDCEEDEEQDEEDSGHGDM